MADENSEDPKSKEASNSDENSAATPPSADESPAEGATSSGEANVVDSAKAAGETSEVDPDSNIDLDLDLDLDDDLADALGEEGAEGGEEIDVDAALAEADPNFGSEIDEISAGDFQGVVIEKDSVSEEVPEDAKVPSAFRAYLGNLPKEIKNRYKMAAGVLAVMIPFAVLIYMGKILPRFDLPYVVSMNELSNDVYTYPVEDVYVPLFDDFRTKAFTVTLPKASINLKSVDGNTAYGQFEFFVNLRDKESQEVVADNQSEILDLIQRVLEQVTWKELQNPIGKEKVKKVIRHRLNEYFKGNIVIGVYYRSVLLQK